MRIEKLHLDCAIAASPQPTSHTCQFIAKIVCRDSKSLRLYQAAGPRPCRTWPVPARGTTITVVPQYGKPGPGPRRAAAPRAIASSQRCRAASRRRAAVAALPRREPSPRCRAGSTSGKQPPVTIMLIMHYNTLVRGTLCTLWSKLWTL